MAGEKEGFEKSRLYFYHAKTFGEWWQSVCIAAEKMDFSAVSLPLTQRNGEKKLLSWNKETTNDSRDTIQMMIPVRDRRAGSMLELHAGIKINGSLESAGRRARLFNRLLDEYNITRIGQKSQEPVQQKI